MPAPAIRIMLATTAIGMAERVKRMAGTPFRWPRRVRRTEMARRETRDWIPLQALTIPREILGKVDDVSLPVNWNLQEFQQTGRASGRQHLERKGDRVEDQIGQGNHKKEVENREAGGVQGFQAPVSRHDPGNEKQDRELLDIVESGDGPGCQAQDSQDCQDDSPTRRRVVKSPETVPFDVEQKPEDQGDKDPVGIGRERHPVVPQFPEVLPGQKASGSHGDGEKKSIGSHTPFLREFPAPDSVVPGSGLLPGKAETLPKGPLF